MTPSVDVESVFSPLVEHAIELAAQWHDGVYRKSCWREPAFDVPADASVQVPVMAHVTTVATIVLRVGWDDATIAAAYLHDVIEDMNQHGQHLRRKELREALGAEVVAIVDGVTEDKYDAEGHVRPWRARKEDYVAQLRTGRVEAMAVSLADKLHNLWTMNQGIEQGDDIFSHGPNRRGLSAGPDQQRWFHRAVLDAAVDHGDDRLVPLRARLHQEVERFEAMIDSL